MARFAFGSLTCKLLTGTALLALTSFAAVGSAHTEFLDEFELDAESYAGLWYEVARTPNDFQDNTITERGVDYGPCRDTTANYSLRGTRFVDIVNSCSRDAIDGQGAFQEEVEGVGVVQSRSDGRKLRIAFGNLFARLVQRFVTGGGSPYWIYGVGPLTEDGQYSWAVVSGPARDAIFVLSREKVLGPEALQDIIELAEAEGLPTEQLIFTQTETR